MAFRPETHRSYCVSEQISSPLPYFEKLARSKALGALGTIESVASKDANRRHMTLTIRFFMAAWQHYSRLEELWMGSWGWTLSATIECASRLRHILFECAYIAA